MLHWSDKQWYDTLVVRYYPKSDEYKIVFRGTDELLPRANLDEFTWRLYPTKWRTEKNPVLDGAIVEFKYDDGKMYQARVYEVEANGDVKVAYLESDETDVVEKGKWKIVKDSPCVAADDE